MNPTLPRNTFRSAPVRVDRKENTFRPGGVPRPTMKQEFARFWNESDVTERILITVSGIATLFVAYAMLIWLPNQA